MKSFKNWLETKDWSPVLPIEKTMTRPSECPFVGTEYNRILQAIDLYTDAGWTFEKVKETALKNDNFLKLLADKALVKPELVKHCVLGLRGKNDHDEDDSWSDDDHGDEL